MPKGLRVTLTQELRQGVSVTPCHGGVRPLLAAVLDLGGIDLDHVPRSVRFVTRFRFPTAPSPPTTHACPCRRSRRAASTRAQPLSCRHRRTDRPRVLRPWSGVRCSSALRPRPGPTRGGPLSGADRTMSLDQVPAPTMPLHEPQQRLPVHVDSLRMHAGLADPGGLLDASLHLDDGVLHVRGAGGRGTQDGLPRRETRRSDRGAPDQFRRHRTWGSEPQSKLFGSSLQGAGESPQLPSDGGGMGLPPKSQLEWRNSL